MTKVEQFESLHHDRVTALHVNFDGTKILTASIDHRIKVWDRSERDAPPQLVETFAAHDGNVKDAKWFHPTTGCHIASVGDDRQLAVHEEDPTQPLRGGRRFRRIAHISSKSSVPFVSLDLKNIDNVYTYLAVIDRQGLLTVYVPTNPDKFTDWEPLDQFQVCPPPGNGEETSFKVRFDPNLSNLAYVNNLTDDTNMLSLVVTAMDQIKVYRAILHGTSGPKSSFFEVASMTLAPKLLIRDVQWAPFNVRGVDYLATATRDGDVTIIEMTCTANAENPNFSKQPSNTRPAPHQSSLTTAIAGRTNQSAGSSPATTATTRHGDPFSYSTQLKVAHTIVRAHKDAWALAWDPSGQVLMSNGSEGTTKMWKMSIVDGEWKEFASTDIEVENEDESLGE